MSWQHSVIKDEVAIADSDTSYSCDLPRSGHIAAILIRLAGTGGSGTPNVEPLVTRIVVSASGPSETYADATGVQINKRAKQLLSTPPPITNASGAATNANYYVMFGRKLRDKRLMLPASKHGTLQLRLSFGTLIATTAFATGTVKLTIETIEWIGAAPAEYAGCCKTVQYTALATGTGDTEIELPEGNLLDTLILNVSDATTVDDLVLGIDNKKETPFAAKFDWLLKRNTAMYDFATAETLYAYMDIMYEGADRAGAIDQALEMNPSRSYKLYISRGSTTTTVTLITVEIVRPSAPAA